MSVLPPRPVGDPDQGGLRNGGPFGEPLVAPPSPLSEFSHWIGIRTASMKTTIVINLTVEETAAIQAAIEQTMNMIRTVRNPDHNDLENKLESVIAKIDFAEIADE